MCVLQWNSERFEKWHRPLLVTPHILLFAAIIWKYSVMKNTTHTIERYEHIAAIEYIMHKQRFFIKSKRLFQPFVTCKRVHIFVFHVMRMCLYCSARNLPAVQRINHCEAYKLSEEVTYINMNNKISNSHKKI